MMTTRDSDPSNTADRQAPHETDLGPVRPPPTPDKSRSFIYDNQLRDLLAPFIAWLATQELDESARRRHRVATERFLRWSHVDDGPSTDRRSRYERHVHQHDPDHLADARTGLDWWTDHRRILASTLPTDR